MSSMISDIFASVPEGYIETAAARKKLIRLYALILAIGIPYLVFVLATGLRLPCVLYELTGYMCPGCGVTRMFASMARLRFSQAFAYNPVAFILFFFWNFTALLTFAGKPRLFRSKRFLFILLIISAVILCIFAILRNIY